jgi:hypothetical protein
MLAGIIGTRGDQSMKIIKSTVGYYLFFYYQYVDNYKCKPISIDDMVNGLLYMQADHKLKELK